MYQRIYSLIVMVKFHHLLAHGPEHPVLAITSK